MRVDNLGIPVFSANDIFELIYQGKAGALPKLLAEPNDTAIENFNNNSETVKIKQYSDLGISQDQFDRALQSDWFMPDEYKTYDIANWILCQCPDVNAYIRAEEELAEYKSRNMMDLLRWLKYFVDTSRKEGIVWGVGRGSSVASYVLYLIGVHKIDSIKYNLDWQEFLR